MPAEDLIEKQIDILGGATLYHFQPYYVKTARNLYASLQWPRKLFHRLEHQGRIKKVKLYPDTRQYAFNTPYICLHAKNEPKSSKPREFEHDFAMRDIILGLMYAYPDYAWKIEYNRVFDLRDGKKYKPDAVLTADNIGQERTYILEHEQSRNPSAIYQEKINSRCEKLDFAANGLSENTQFLFSYTHETFNVYTRPMEYDRIAERIIKIDGQVASLAHRVKHLNPKKYRFTALHNFTLLNEKVWLTPAGEYVRLINK